MLFDVVFVSKISENLGGQMLTLPIQSGAAPGRAPYIVGFATVSFFLVILEMKGFALLSILESSHSLFST